MAPALASVMISGVPVCAPVVPSASKPNVSLQYHSVVANLGTKEVRFTSRSVFQNNSGVDETFDLKVPFRAISVLDHRDMLAAPASGSLDGNALTFKRNPRDLAMSSVKGGGKDSYDYTASMTARVTFKARASHVVTLSFTLPTGLAGEDHALRTMGYGTQGFDSWQGTCEQLAFTVDFARETYRSNPADPDEKYMGYSVFAAHSTEPKTGWEVGEKRAFFEAYKARSSVGPLFFTFHPNGYRDFKRS